MESDERQKARALLLDDYNHDDNFRDVQLDLVVGEQTIEVVVKALPMREFQNPYVPDDLIDDIGLEEATKITLVTKCVYTPDGDRVYNPPKSEENPGDVYQIVDGPMTRNGPIERLHHAVNYVHGFTPTPPPGVADPRLDEIARAAEQLGDLAEAAEAEDESLDAAELKDLGELIANRARYIDHGSTAGK